MRKPYAELFLAGILAVHMLLMFAVRPFRFPNNGLDPSWQLVITHAAENGWAWGKDIVFTFGPLGYMYWHLFSDKLFVSTILGDAFIAVIVTAGALSLFHRLPIFALLTVYFGFLLSTSLIDPLLFSIPILALFGYFRRPSPVHWGILCLLTIACAYVALIKLSFFILALSVLAVMDVDRTAHKLPPLFAPIFCFFIVVFFVLSGQPFANIIPFAASATAVVAGYTEAMSVPGNPYELIAFLAAAGTLISLVVTTEFLATPRRDPKSAGLLILAILLIMGMALKAGFVRHDLHSLIGWSVLSLMLIYYTASSWATIAPPILRSILVAATVLLACVQPIVLGFETGKPASQLLADRFIGHPSKSLGALLGTSRSPQYSFDRMHLEEARRSELNRVRNEYPLPDLGSVTVDTLPSIQSAVLAHGFDYRPRPSFQEFGTYNERLIELNRAYLRSASAPEFLLFSFRSGNIDNRVPSMIEGPLWPEILQRYDLAGVENNVLIMHRRSIARETLMRPDIVHNGQLGQVVSVPKRSGAVFIKIDVRPSLVGALRSAVFKLDPVSITLKLANGQERTHRLIPAIAREGFVLSPYIANDYEFALLASGQTDLLAANEVSGIQVDADSRWYDPSVTFQFISLDTTRLHQTADVPAFLATNANRFNSLSMLLRSSAEGPPRTSLQNNQLYTHAPSSLYIDVSNAKRIEVDFGIADGAWQKSNWTNGACFSVRTGAIGAAAAQRRLLWQRCLDPRAVAGDRGHQHAAIELDDPFAGRLFFEIDCRQDCRWDWTYWKSVLLNP